MAARSKEGIIKGTLHEQVKEIRELQVHRQEVLVDFLNFELKLGVTFINCARTVPHGKSKECAKNASAAVQRFLPHVQDRSVWVQLARRLDELDGAISRSTEAH